MQSLQYTIDSICASVTTECVYEMVRALLDLGQFTIDDIVPFIQTKDRSLDFRSAKMIAEVALAEMEQSGEIKIEGNNILSATKS